MESQKRWLLHFNYYNRQIYIDGKKLKIHGPVKDSAGVSFGNVYVDRRLLASRVVFQPHDDDPDVSDADTGLLAI